MLNAFCLLNHELTPKQVSELHGSFKVERIVYPPGRIAALWGNISVDGELTKTHIESFASWLEEARTGDITVIQGEFGAVFSLVDFAFQKGLIPVYATTKRVAAESRTGEQVYRRYIFEHQCFRPYRYYRDLF